MKQTLITRTWAWILGSAFLISIGSSAGAAQMVIVDQPTAPGVSVRFVAEPSSDGGTLKIVNHTGQGALLKIGEQHSWFVIPPHGIKELPLGKSKGRSYTLYHSVGPGLTSTVIPATLQGQIALP